MPKLTGQDLEFQAEDDLRTLQRAEEVRSNKTRLNRAKKVANKQMKALKKVAGKKSGGEKGKR